MDAAAAVYGVNVLLGLAHVVTEVSSSVVVAAHLGVASLVWTLLVAATAEAARPGVAQRQVALAESENRLPMYGAVGERAEEG